ncbi:UNVERIFIED_ORG: putative ATP-grasp superfamily ATP-dependent carboligase [Rahnella aquatilis]
MMMSKNTNVIFIVTSKERNELYSRAFSDRKVMYECFESQNPVKALDNSLYQNEILRQSSLINYIECNSENTKFYGFSTTGYDQRIEDDNVLLNLLLNKNGLMFGHNTASLAIMLNKSLSKMYARNSAFSVPSGSDFDEFSQDFFSSQPADAFWVVKPKDGASGEGVSILTSREVNDKIDSFLYANMLYEEFIDGIEISFTSFYCNGVFVYYPLIVKGRTDTEGTHPLRKVRYTGARVPESLTTSISHLAASFAKKLNASGWLDFDLVIRHGRVFFLEVNPRFCGTTNMTSLSCSPNPFDISCDFLLGSQLPGYVSPSMDVFELPLSHKRVCDEAYVAYTQLSNTNKQIGRVGIAVKNFDEIHHHIHQFGHDDEINDWSEQLNSMQSNLDELRNFSDQNYQES